MVDPRKETLHLHLRTAALRWGIRLAMCYVRLSTSVNGALNVFEVVLRGAIDLWRVERP